MKPSTRSLLENITIEIPVGHVNQGSQGGVLPVIVKDKVIKNGLMICPHCNCEIHEKGSYQEAGEECETHGECGGKFTMPEPSDEDKAWLAKMWKTPNYQ